MSSVTQAAIARVLHGKADSLVRRDRDFLDRLIDPDFVYVTTKGSRLDKARYISMCCDPGNLEFSEQIVSNLDVRDFGAFAVASFSVDDRFSWQGRQLGGRYQSIVVFRQTGTGWLWAAGQTMEPKAD